MGEVGLALAEAGDFGGGHGEAGAAQGDAEVLVVPVGNVPLAAVLPQADDVLDSVPVAVEGNHRGQGSFGALGQQEVHRHLRVGAGAQEDLLPQVIPLVHHLDPAGRRGGGVSFLEAEKPAERARRVVLCQRRAAAAVSALKARGAAAGSYCFHSDVAGCSGFTVRMSSTLEAMLFLLGGGGAAAYEKSVDFCALMPRSTSGSVRYGAGGINLRLRALSIRIAASATSGSSRPASRAGRSWSPGCTTPVPPPLPWRAGTSRARSPRRRRRGRRR